VKEKHVSFKIDGGIKSVFSMCINEGFSLHVTRLQNESKTFWHGTLHVRSYNEFKATLNGCRESLSLGIEMPNGKFPWSLPLPPRPRSLRRLPA
jgi:hypothetical protein